MHFTDDEGKLIGTRFPSEFESQIASSLKDQFEARLKKPKFFVEGLFEHQQVTLKLGYLEEGRLKQNNFWVRFRFDASQENAKDQIHQALDFLGSLISEFIDSDERLEIPRTWKPVKSPLFGGEVLYSTENSDLEAAADAFLKESLH